MNATQHARYEVRTRVENLLYGIYSAWVGFTTPEAAPGLNASVVPVVLSTTTTSAVVVYSFSGTPNGVLVNASVVLSNSTMLVPSVVPASPTANVMVGFVNVTGLAPAGLYSARVRWCTAAGCADSSPATITTRGIAPGPVNITCVAHLCCFLALLRHSCAFAHLPQSWQVHS